MRRTTRTQSRVNHCDHQAAVGRVALRACRGTGRCATVRGSSIRDVVHDFRQTRCSDASRAKAHSRDLLLWASFNEACTRRWPWRVPSTAGMGRCSAVWLQQVQACTAARDQVAVAMQGSLFDLQEPEPPVDRYAATRRRAEHGPMLVSLACRMADQRYTEIAVGWARDVWRLALAAES